MAEVDPVSTKTSINGSERVTNTLISLLETAGISAAKEIQGSAALNIHIKGLSDADILILKNDIVLVQTPQLDGTGCYAADPRPMADISCQPSTSTRDASRVGSAVTPGTSFAVSLGSVVPQSWLLSP